MSSAILTVAFIAIVVGLQLAWWWFRLRGKPYEAVIEGVRVTIRADGHVQLHETPTDEELDRVTAWVAKHGVPDSASWRVLERPFQ